MKSTCLGLIAAVFFSPIMAQTEPEFLTFYPDCGYEIVDTVVHNGMIRGNLEKTAQYYVTQRLDRLRPEILKKAQDNNIQYIVLKDIKLIPVRDGAVRFRTTIEHIKTCHNPHTLGGKPTPYNASGQKQFIMGDVQVGESRTIVFEATKTNQRPDIGDDVGVSLTTGLYGMPLGKTQNEVVETFGSPSFWYRDGSGIELIAYGRRHWLTFQADKLVKAQYGDTVFSNELINYFIFDERFDDRQWRVQQEIERDSLLSSEVNPGAYDNDKHSLSIITEVFLENGQQDRNHRAVGFELKHKGAKDHKISFSDADTVDNQAFLHNALTNLGEFDNVDAELVRNRTLGRTSTENSKQYLLLDEATLVQTVGDAVSKIILSTGFIKGQSPGWRFGEFYSGQDMQEVLQIAGAAGFYMDGVLTLEKGRYTMTLYAAQQAGGDKLDAAEIAIY